MYRPHPTPTRVSIPLFASRVVAGFPSPADDYVEAHLDLNEHLIEHEAATFFVRAKGDSMTAAGIRDGDLLIVDRAREAVHGDIVIAVLDGALAVKRLWMQRGGVALLSENPAFSPIRLKEGQELEVWGVVTSVVHRFVR